MEDVKIYRINDEISFRKCSLFESKDTKHGDCTNFDEFQENWKTYFSCNQYGVHLHCTKHPEIEFNVERDYKSAILKCPKCNNEITLDDYDETIRNCLKMLNIEKFKGAKLIRLDDWYTPELKRKIDTPSDYWIKADVKTDKDGDTIIVLYVGHTGSKNKTQFFIKPEKLQLTSDHKDLDPATVLSKIEVTLKGRTLTQKYE